MTPALQRVRKPSLTKAAAPVEPRYPIADLLICLCLVLLTALVYAPVRQHQFLYLDDADYVTGNAQVQHGLRLQSLAWAVTHSHSANWHPLTWMSHMLDCQLWGLNPGGQGRKSTRLNSSH